MLRLVPLLPLAACAACAAPAADARAPVEFVIESDFGNEAGWVRGHLEAAADALVRLMAAPELAPPRRIEVTLERDPGAEGGVGGWAGPAVIGLVSDDCPKETVRLWILTHELANLFAAHYGGAGGFPSDWWSNGRSPFPAYLAGLVLREVGETEAADWLRSSSASEADHRLYWELHGRYGFDLFARTLGLLRRDEIDLGEFEPPWPVAYLSLAAGENLTETVLSFGIGREPADWQLVHPELPFEEYTLSAAEVEEIGRAREELFERAAPERARDLFRAGRWSEALDAARPAGPPTAPSRARRPGPPGTVPGS